MSRPTRFRGDELDLYGEFNHELVKELMRDTRFTREIADDASAKAWIEFFRAQPDRREGRWRVWLFETAEREAKRLVDSQGADPSLSRLDVADPRNLQAERVEFQAALQELRRLPPRLRQAVVISSQVAKHADVAEVMGVSRQRVAQLLAAAASKVGSRAGLIGTRPAPRSFATGRSAARSRGRAAEVADQRHRDVPDAGGFQRSTDPGVAPRRACDS